MKTYIIISERAFCYIVFIKGNRLVYLSITDDSADDCVALCHNIPDTIAKSMKHLIVNLDNYSREFFSDEWKWYDTTNL